ncbi:hypothetical protein EG359_17405 [Chryseobacterium joostei]|uniref:Terminase small subunit protein n=1 Tax=Chryseobacterium joostei TaxID=112234 RepID=A0A1N7IB35_9FLAO|nr:hypothetical protein [Chryseobacterium joostei]AZB01281.1 hypothetical protein EG359_17405 [Chryseobacterium joostei]SIS34279.1 hypothetical protein SAMN05421768_103681 [Chryseobacterium joostei]
MAYSEERKDKIFKKIISEIADKGKSLRAVLREKGMPSSSTFFIWLEDDESKSKQYARAVEVRAEGIFDEIIDIAENSEKDQTPFTGINVIKRDTLRIDARKWMLSKMMPKKYGDKLDITSDGDKVSGSIPLVLEDGRSYEDLIKELKTDEES